MKEWLELTIKEIEAGWPNMDSYAPECQELLSFILTRLRFKLQNIDEELKVRDTEIFAAGYKSGLMTTYEEAK